MDRKLLVLAAAVGSTLAPGTIPDALADRLGANYRGPWDTYRVHEDLPPPAKPPSERDPLLASLDLDLPFLSGFKAGREEARFRGRPLLVFYALPGSGACASTAGRVFRDAAVRELAAGFVPVVANAGKERVFGISYGLKTIPSILLLDTAGLELGRAEGEVDADLAAAALREALKKAGAVRPTPAAQALEAAAVLLSRSRKAKDWKALLRTAASIEKIGHDGPEREEARRARDEAAREAAARLEAAKGSIRRDREDAARLALAKIAREFEGLDEAVEATELLRALVAPKTTAAGFAARLRPAGVPNGIVENGVPTTGTPGLRILAPAQKGPAATTGSEVLPKPGQDPEPPPPPEPP